MKISEIPVSEYQFRLADTLSRQSFTGITIGLNHSLPEIIKMTWGWPAISVLFNYQHEPVAFFSAMNIRNQWFSLPHFNHSAIYFQDEAITRYFAHRPDYKTPLIHVKQNIYSSFVSQLHGLDNKNHGTFSIELNEEEIINDRPIPDHPEFISRDNCSLSNFVDTHKTLSLLSLHNDEHQQFQAYPRGVRHKIRKAESNGIQIISGGIEHIDAFYQVYRQNIHRLGSFGLPKRFFSNLIKHYRNGNAKIFLALLDGECIGSAIILTYGTYAENPWFASTPDGNRKYVTYALHHAMILESIRNECTQYSFGRSTVNSSVHIYKQQWGTTDQPVFLNSNSRIPVNTDKFRYLRKVIRHIPLPLIKPMDKPVSRYIY